MSPNNHEIECVSRDDTTFIRMQFHESTSLVPTMDSALMRFGSYSFKVLSFAGSCSTRAARRACFFKCAVNPTIVSVLSYFSSFGDRQIGGAMASDWVWPATSQNKAKSLF